MGSTAYAANGSSDGDKDKAVDEFLAPTVNPAMQTTMSLLEKYGIDERNQKYEGAYTLEETDSGTRLVVRYTRTHNAANSLLAALKEVQAESPIAIDIIPVDFNMAESEAVAALLMGADSPLVTEYGLTPTIAVVDMMTGKVNVETSDLLEGEAARGPSDALSLSIEGVDIDVHLGVGQPMDLQYSRNDDAAPYSGGIALDSGNVGVTMGFTWVRWSDGELMGSTAEHAWEETGVSTWYSNGLVGTRYFYNTKTDSTLLRSSPQSQFNHNMYVGDSTTSNRRDVVGALNNLAYGTPMAINGRFGLRPATTVIGVGAFTGGKGPFVLTSSGACSAGDSGGPWIQTDGVGDVIAAGQHVGRAYYSGAYRCVVSPLGPISSAMAASIYTR
ncbi:hypothetical protein J2Y69_000391 [Microbacterium resistens]|uniref:Uncharacterized protein n=1 Tax=Microbacterium resistens TaxID=156977 RepID=A0ABU1S873_9MICO|nr:hypothetical protein [Microbacterium resistens]MDR6865809.1 hypothetical protein [Microbacterium resistens]